MSCPPFTIQIQGDLQQSLDKGKKAAAREGVNFAGDTTGGRFSGRGVTGNYSVGEDNVVTISVTSICFPASMMYDCRGIEAKVREFFQA